MSASPLIVHGFETSNNMKVRVGLGYKSIPYRFETIDPKDRSAGRGNGVGKLTNVPVAVSAEHDGADTHDKTSWEMIVFIISLVPP